MAAPIVFIDIAGPDDETLKAFYAEVFDWRADASGQFDLDIPTSIRAAIRKDPAEKRLYLGVEDITATLEAVEAAGGSIDARRFEVPGVVVLGLFRDPAGNPLGLVEMDGPRRRIP
ncbi:MAG: VOC family protein [Wenzhouxiangellaceae bacterium]|nr:VOC family protein [Wenzhouxiangellaceae bacterium]